MTLSLASSPFGKTRSKTWMIPATRSPTAATYQISTLRGFGRKKRLEDETRETDHPNFSVQRFHIFHFVYHPKGFIEKKTTQAKSINELSVSSRIYSFLSLPPPFSHEIIIGTNCSSVLLNKVTNDVLVC